MYTRNYEVSQNIRTTGRNIILFLNFLRPIYILLSTTLAITQRCDISAHLHSSPS